MGLLGVSEFMGLAAAIVAIMLGIQFSIEGVILVVGTIVVRVLSGGRIK
jgi:hypothetical protein